MPRAIHEARPAEVKSGLKSELGSVGPKPPRVSATASSATPPSNRFVVRLIGVRMSPRSVRYQCPSKSPSITAPRNPAPASSWSRATIRVPSPVPAIATSTAIETQAEAIPSTRATRGRRRKSSATHARRSTASAAESRKDHVPASSPSTRPAATEPHEAVASTNSTAPVSLKKPRFTSPHKGVRNSSASPPATVSARTSAVTPAGPFMPPPCPTQPTRGHAAADHPTAGSLSRMDDWRSYDAVAETYGRVHAPRLAGPAVDLVRLAGVEGDSRVLDVGTGTGVAAIAALDAVVGNFVVSHFTKYETALFDMTRVLRHGGRMALSAWADGEDELTRTWVELVESIVPRRILQSSISEALPWRERFRDREALQEALMDAGLRQIRTEVRQYRFVYGLDEYVEGLGTWATGRFVRSMLGETAFASFLERARGVFSERFADPVNDFRDVVFAIGRKP